MKEHVSFMKEPMDHFVAFMEASDRWCNNYDENLHLFDSFLSKNYQDATILTNDMVDGVTREVARVHNQGIPA